MTKEQVQELMAVTVVFGQEPTGVTEESKSLFLGYESQIGSPAAVYLAYVTQPSWDYLTYIVGDCGRSLRLDGFSWGYLGEGCRGLMWLFEHLGWTIDPATLPPSNTEGVWRVYADGSVLPSRD